MTTALSVTGESATKSLQNSCCFKVCISFQNAVNKQQLLLDIFLRAWMRGVSQAIVFVVLN